MKKLSISTGILIILLLISAILSAQEQYTPYDDAPGIIKSYKPAYNENFPDWAKMLYHSPINYYKITEAFDQSEEKNTKNAISRYFKIWRQHIEPWVKEDGSIHLPNMDSYYTKLRETQLQANSNPSREENAESNWTFLGPKETFLLNTSGASNPPPRPWQVNIYSLDVSPSNNNILFCGTETGFINKSIDYGENWELMAQNYPFGSGITAIAIHPENSNIVYAAAGNQIHKSVDGGENWVPILNSENQFYADRLIIDDENPDKLFAASSAGVYVTNDAGANWDRNWNYRAYDVVIQPSNHDVIYALSKSSGTFDIIVSTDGGLNFELDPNFPTTISDESGGLLAMSPADPNSLWVIMLGNDYTPYLYKGNMSAGEWELIATGQTSEFPMNNGQGYFDLVLEVSPNDANLVFVGTTTLYKSSNGGANFYIVGGYGGPFTIHPDIQDMKMLPNGDMWVSTDGGMNFSSDHFTNTNNHYCKTKGIVGSAMWGFDQGWNEDITVGGRYHNGNTALADFYGDKAIQLGGAESPTGWIIKGKSRYAAFDDLGNGWILPQTAEGQSEGRFIFTKYPNMDEYGGRRGNMVFHPNYYEMIYMGQGNGFWKSSDMGVSHDLLYDFGAQVRFLQISYHNPNVLYADVVGQGLMRTSDGGESWENKPSLTNGEFGNSYWKGRTFFALSPTNENIIYACLQNGSWSGDIGEIFKSTDGGDTWEDWTGSLSEYTKNIIVQPDAEGNDIVYLFTLSRNGQAAKVFIRDASMNDWELFNNNYPAGNDVNMSLPFYRDSKLRVAGSTGIWESPMAVEDFLPIINPWINAPVNHCMMDTIVFDDHSILNHEGATWQWEITPEPEYVDDYNIRNPKVVLGNPGTYDVTLTVIKNGETYSKTINNMVTTSTCPSIYDCSNPAELPKEIWELVYVDSEEINYPGLATMSFDDDPATIWHTRWSTGSDPYPHEIQVNLGDVYSVFSFTYLTRQSGSNGSISEYKLYISNDIEDWGEPVSTGQFENTSAPQTIELDTPKEGQFFKLIALSEVNGNAWSSAAEFSIIGCKDITNTHNVNRFEELTAFPVPTTGDITIPLPFANKFFYKISTLSGQVISNREIENPSDNLKINLSSYSNGVYIIHLSTEAGLHYRVKLVKE